MGKPVPVPDHIIELDINQYCDAGPFQGIIIVPFSADPFSGGFIGDVQATSELVTVVVPVPAALSEGAQLSKSSTGCSLAD